MRTASNNFINFLANSTEFLMGEFFTITLANNSQLRYTSLDVAKSFNNATYSANEVLIKRGSLKWARGLDVDRMSLSIYPGNNANIGNSAFLSAVRNGALDGAWIRLDRVFYSDWNNAAGNICLFYGRVSDLELSRTCASIEVSSILELLDTDWPLNIYMPSCGWTLYGNACGANKTSFTSNAQVSGNGTTVSFNSNLARANNYYDQGVIVFTSGPNVGARRTVKSFANAAGVITLVQPLLANASNGANFTIYPGCDKTMATCANKFNNVDANGYLKFRGFPFIPVPETAL